jgi:hypothetical protein
MLPGAEPKKQKNGQLHNETPCLAPTESVAGHRTRMEGALDDGAPPAINRKPTTTTAVTDSRKRSHLSPAPPPKKNRFKTS